MRGCITRRGKRWCGWRESCNFKLRQSYVRLGKRALVNQGRYGAARQLKRARRETRKLRTYLGRVLRNVERGKLKLSAKQAQLVSVARRILTQQRTDHGKVYSVHAPEVECIAKGKVPKHYEFGCKVRDRHHLAAELDCRDRCRTRQSL